VDAQLETLIDLQAYDGQIAKLETEAARLPRQIDALRAALTDARKSVENLRARLDATKKDLRAKEKDLDVVAGKRSKAEGRLYEVKTNKEYSAVLTEIEDIKQEKAKTEEEILALMEMQERLAADSQEAEADLKRREEQSQRDEATIRQKLGVVETELQDVRGERASRARDLSRVVLADYEKILKARGGLAVVAVTNSVCAACRVALRPQVIQELRTAATLMVCESCGRYLYWHEPA